MLAVVLAGGQSRRMGQDKALLTLADKTFIETIYDELRGYFSEIVISANNPEPYFHLGLKILRDEYEGLGPLAGIHSGLSYAQKRGKKHIFVVSCDMPMISGRLAYRMVELLEEDYQAVVPKAGDRIFPTFSAYSVRAFAEIDQALREERLRLQAILRELNTYWLLEDEIALYGEPLKILRNVNNLKEYLDLRDIYGEEEDSERNKG